MSQSNERTNRVEFKMRETYRRVQNRATFRIVWDRILTDAERSRLGGTVDACYEKYGGTAGLWMALHPVSVLRAIIQVALRTHQLSKMDYRWLDAEISKVDPLLPAPWRAAPRPGRADDDPDEIVDRARLSHRLVMVQGNGFRRLFWDGERVPVDWGRNTLLWELMWQLALKGKLGGSVAWDELTNSTSGRFIVRRRSRLKKVIPPDLNKLIKTGEAGYYKLMIDRFQVKLIELRPNEYLVEPD